MVDRTKPPPGWYVSEGGIVREGVGVRTVAEAWSIFDEETLEALGVGPYRLIDGQWYAPAGNVPAAIHAARVDAAAEPRIVIERAAAALEHLVGRGRVVEYLRAYLDGRESEVDLDEEA